MSRTDPISDFATGIRNAVASGQDFILWEQSKLLEAIAKILQKEGFIEKVEVVSFEKKGKKNPRQFLRLELRYIDERKTRSLIKTIKRISKPGRRVYCGYSELKPVSGGIGIKIISSPRGIISDVEARRLKVGGEVLLEVY